MTVEAWTQTPVYTIAGIGPYGIAHPYATGAILVTVVNGTDRIALTDTDFTVTPASSDTLGDVFLTPTAAATHAGRTLIIDRLTPDEQGWQAVQGEREAGLMAQLDRLTQSVQEIRKDAAGAVRIRGNLVAFDWAEGTVPVRMGNRVVSGPAAADLGNGAANAAAAAASAAQAAAAAVLAQEALAAIEAIEGSLPALRLAWATGTAYLRGDIVSIYGGSEICLFPHTSGDFDTDRSNGLWQNLATRGASGAGSGDVLSTENLADLASIPAARGNLGLGSIATQSADNVAITGGVIVGIDPLGFAEGGTGGASPAAARAALGVPPVTRQILVGGLASGGGDLTDNIVINVPRATLEEAQDGTRNDLAMTPLTVRQAIEAQSSGLPDIVAGDSVRYELATELFTTSQTLVPVGHSMSFAQDGSIRWRVEIRRQAGGTHTYTIRRTRAGVVTDVATFTTTSGAYVPQSVDLDVLAGDSFAAVYRNNSSDPSYVRNFSIGLDAASRLIPVSNFGQIRNNP